MMEQQNCNNIIHFFNFTNVFRNKSVILLPPGYSNLSDEKKIEMISMDISKLQAENANLRKNFAEYLANQYQGNFYTIEAKQFEEAEVDESELQKLKRSKSELRATILNLEGELKKKSSEDIKDIQKSFVSLNNLLIDREAGRITSDIQEKLDLLKEVQIQLQHVTSERDIYIGEQKQFETKIISNNKKIKDLQELNQLGNKNFENLKTENSSLQIECEKLKNNLEILGGNKSQLDKDYVKLQEFYNKLRDDFSKLKDEKYELVVKTTALDKQVESLNTAVENKTKEIDDQTSRLSMIDKQDKSDAQYELFLKLQREINENLKKVQSGGDMSGMTSQKSIKTSNLQQVHEIEKLRIRAAQYDDLINKIKKLTNRNDELENELRNKNLEIEKLKKLFNIPEEITEESQLKELIAYRP